MKHYDLSKLINNIIIMDQLVQRYFLLNNRRDKQKL